MNRDDRSKVAETPDEDPRAEEEELREGDIRDDVTTREIVDDWLWEQYGFGVTRLEEEFGDLAPTESAFDSCSSETIEAVEPNEVTAGVHVRRVDVDETFDDMPFMVELHQHFPPEDNRAGDTVAIHGEHAVLQTIAALAQVTTGRFEEVPWDVE